MFLVAQEGNTAKQASWLHPSFVALDAFNGFRQAARLAVNGGGFMRFSAGSEGGCWRLERDGAVLADLHPPGLQIRDDLSRT